MIYATSAMACTANSTLFADRKGHMQDSKALMETALALHGSIRKADKAAKREDLSKTLKDIKEVKNVANEIPIIGHSMQKERLLYPEKL